MKDCSAIKRKLFGKFTIAFVIFTFLAAGDLSAQQYLFGRTSVRLGTNVVGMAVADFNSDGISDVAVVDFSSKTISVLLGKPDGTLAAPIDTGFNLPFQIFPFQALAAGDFNHDGKADLAVIDSDSSLAILLGNGDGTFRPPVDYATGLDVNAITVADLNHDGKLDLVTSNRCTPSVSVLLGNGDGTFQRHVDYDAFQGGGCGEVNDRVIVADLNGDGIPDLALAGSGSVSVLLGKGDGTFQAYQQYSVNPAATAVTVGDFNGDGKLDLATSNQAAGTVSILLGKGDGTFPTCVDYPGATGLYAFDIFTADLNGDGKADLAIASTTTYSPWGNGSIAVLLGNGDGSFQAPATYGTGVHPLLSFADFNGDGHLDFAIASNKCSLSCPVSDVSIVLGFGDGRFPEARQFQAIEDQAAVATGDFNGDGKADVVVVGGSSPSAGVSILLGNGNGGFQAHTDYATGVQPTAVIAVDFNHDGRADVALVNYTSNTLSVYLSNADGTLRPRTDYPTGQNPGTLVAADFNRDGNLDVAVLVTNYTGPGAIMVFLGDGHGGFTNSGTFPSVGWDNSLIAGDFNGDGKIDLVTAAGANPLGAVLLLGNGDGTFRAPVPLNESDAVYNLIAGDFNGDGKLDLAGTSQAGNSIGVLLGNGDGTFRTGWKSQTLDAWGILMAADVNGDGKLDLVVSQNAYSSLFVMLGNGNGTFQEPQHFAHDFMLNAMTAGDFSGHGGTDLVAANYSGSTIIFLPNLPEVALYPTAAMFAAQPVDTSSQPYRFWLSNPSGMQVKLSNLAITGEFHQTNTCPSTLGIGSNCGISATFAPTAAGLALGTLTITETQPVSRQTVPLAGTGMNYIQALPGLIDFGLVKVGQLSPVRVVNLRNLSHAAVAVSSIGVTGTLPTDFSETNDCGVAIPAQGSCHVMVRFKPTAPAQRSAGLTIVPAAPAISSSVMLRGRGVR